MVKHKNEKVCINMGSSQKHNDISLKLEIDFPYDPLIDIHPRAQKLYSEEISTHMFIEALLLLAQN